MSIEKTKDQLIRLLSEDDNRVIALSGRWGTGKTHLWNEVQKSSSDSTVKNAHYVSLFGQSSIDQVKRRLIEVAIPVAQSHGEAFEGLKHIITTGMQAVSKHYKALAALNNLNVLLMAPVVLRDKLIIIDDIERKHKNLGINEILGFIDEYSKQHDARFLLILNDDQLKAVGDQLELWETLREKIIDHEIKLTTTAGEAFTIAINERPSRYADSIQNASKICGLTNIRILHRVIKLVNLILAERDLEDAVLERVVPSIVLFSAIYYRGLDDGPDFNFALNIGKADWEEYFGDKENSGDSAEKNREAGWRNLIDELGIRVCDEFEQCLVEFLESGLLDPTSIELIIDRYERETDELKARSAANLFIQRVIWDHRTSESELVVEAAELRTSAAYLDPYTATLLDSELSELPGGSDIGDQIIDTWIEAFREEGHQEADLSNPFGNPIHPKIQAEFDALHETTQAGITAVDACLHIQANRGWGTMQQIALQNATTSDFETAIHEIPDMDTLISFMRQMMKMTAQRSNYDDHFGSATQHFIEACKVIANDPKSSRLAGLIQVLFRAESLESELVIKTKRPQTTD